MDSNTGTSELFNIVIQNMQTMKFHKVTKFDLTVAHPPVLKPNSSQGIHAIEKWITPWPEISFERVSFPKYEGIYQYLGEPSNKPDFIKDYHIISLMRNIDYWSKPAYDARIKATANTPTTT